MLSILKRYVVVVTLLLVECFRRQTKQFIHRVYHTAEYIKTMRKVNKHYNNNNNNYYSFK